MTSASGLRARFLEQFSPDVAAGLADWTSAICKLDVDILIFMARKSYCLFDALRRLGVRLPEAIVVTDRILDQNLVRLRGKRVALIDDTVILGTTLARARRQLEEAGCIVQVHAFCYDEDFYVPEILTLDSVQLRMTDDAVKTFCASEVRALMQLPRPYIVDFPVSENVRVDDALRDALLSGIEWESFNLTTPEQEAAGVVTYTFFPSGPTELELVRSVGREVAEVIDLLKVRAFGRYVDGHLWLTTVPLVTLRPMSSADVEMLARGLITEVAEQAGRDLSELVGSIQRPEGWARLVQYVLGCALGARFCRGFTRSGSKAILRFQDHDADANWGPWHHHEIETIIQHAGKVLWPVDDANADTTHGANSVAVRRALRSVEAVVLPERVRDRTNALFDDADVVPDGIRLRIDDLPSRWSGRLDADLSEVFLALFQRYELPARNEVRTLGADSIGPNSKPTPYRDRLENGIPWSEIVGYFGQRYGLDVSTEMRRQFSLTLDRLNDLGIAVPITCVVGDIVFRAYRHGEDVNFADAECDLAYELFDGVLETTGWSSLPRLVVEKILVLMLELGPAKRLLTRRFDERPQPLTARVAYNLHGAVAKFRAGPSSVADGELWLHDYLLRRKVLAVDKKDVYVLGRKVNASQARSDALQTAFSFGTLLGHVLKGSEPGKRDGVLTDEDLVALTTCHSVSSVLGALQAELSALTYWWSNQGRGFPVGELKSNEAAAVAVRTFRREDGRTAIHSASFKCDLFTAKAWQKAILAAEASLGRRDSKEWTSWFAPLVDSEAVGGHVDLEERLKASGLVVWRAGALLTLIETALGYLAKPSKLANLCKEFEHHDQNFAEHIEPVVRSEEPEDVPWARQIVQRWRSTAPPLEDVRTVMREAQERMDAVCGEAHLQMDLAESVLATAGRFRTIKRYAYVVWYDLIDSVGNRSGEDGTDDVVRRRHAVERFTSTINRALTELQAECGRRDADLYAWKGDLESTDDGKHLAVGGKQALYWVSRVVSVVDEASTTYGLQYRMAIVPTDFVGTSLERARDATEPIGDLFLQHLSRITVRVKDAASGRPGRSVLALVGRRLIDDNDLPRQLNLENAERTTFVTEVNLGRRESPVVMGEVRRPRR